MRFKMSVSYRKKTINEIAKAPTAPVKPAGPVNVDFYGEDHARIPAQGCLRKADCNH